MKLWRIILLSIPFYILWAACGDAEIKNERDPTEISGIVEEKLDSIFHLLNSNQFDVVQKLLIKTIDLSRSYYELYLINCYQAELFYFNDLCEQGKTIIDATLPIAEKLKKPELLGNCYNFKGLFALAEFRFDSALFYFNKAKNLIPPELNDRHLVRYDQILNNLAETHLRTGACDSAIYYAQTSINLTNLIKKNRTLAISYWTVGEAYSCMYEHEKALENFNLSISLGRRYGESDIIHYNLAGLIRVFQNRAGSKKIYELINNGLDWSLINSSSPLAIKEFYQSALKSLEFLNDVKFQLKLTKQYLDFMEFTRKRELHNQTQVVQQYFSYVEQLAKAKLSDNLMQQEISFNKKMMAVLITLVFSLVAFFVMLFVYRSNKAKILKVEQENAMLQLKSEMEISQFKVRKEAIENERTRLARELHDDIGSAISSARIYAQVALQHFDAQPEKSKETLNKLILQIQQTNENLSDLIWAIYSKQEDFEHLVERIKQQAFDVLSMSNIEFKIEYPIEKGHLIMRLEARKNLLLLFKEFINNTTKYAKATKVIMQIEITPTQFLMKVEDNGVGFSKDTTKHGYGLGTMKARVNSLKGESSLYSKEGKGTQLQINVPFNEVFQS